MPKGQRVDYTDRSIHDDPERFAEPETITLSGGKDYSMRQHTVPASRRGQWGHS